MVECCLFDRLFNRWKSCISHMMCSAAPFLGTDFFYLLIELHNNCLRGLDFNVRVIIRQRYVFCIINVDNIICIIFNVDNILNSVQLTLLRWSTWIGYSASSRLS